MVLEIENFFGVYMLYSTNPKYKGYTYIGFTVDPNRRITQHNRGKQSGGAKKTSGRGPWEMVLIVHGFQNEITALRFEWAWQNPNRSRRLKHLPGKRRSENRYQFRFRILSEMLRTGPWNRLGLTIRWLLQEYKLDFDPVRLPPPHMAIAYGPVKSTKVEPRSDTVDLTQEQSRKKCSVCRAKLKKVNRRKKDIVHGQLQEDSNVVRCLQRQCSMVCHTLCLARRFLGDSGELLPIEGACPKCSTQMLWSDIIRYKTGCYHKLNQICSQGEGESEGHWADDLQT